MTAGLLGIHHVTAIAGDPQRNVEFYTGMFGLRERLGERLQLPAWLEPARAQIEERLPPLRPVTAL